MTHLNSPIRPDAWLRDLFMCKAVQHGQLVRRKTRDIERIVGMDKFLLEVRRRGFRAIENRGQVIVICNQEPVRVLA